MAKARAKEAGKGAPDPVLKELVRIRGLLVLLLMKNGAKSRDLDVALKMGPGNIREAYPEGRLEHLLGKE